MIDVPRAETESLRFGAKACLQDDRGEVVLLRRRIDPPGVLDLPGGTVEPRETPEEALRRELCEELGPDVEAELNYLGSHWLDLELGPRTLSIVYAGTLHGRYTNADPDDHVRLVTMPLDRAADRLDLSPSARFALSRMPHRGPETAALPRAGLESDVLLLQPFFPLADEDALSIPLGLAYIASCLDAAGVSVTALDCSLASDYDWFINWFDTSHFKVIGVQFHSAMSWDFCIRTCARVRRVFPNAVLVAGGELATLRADQLLSERVVDVVVHDEGEQSATELIVALLNGASIRQVALIPGVVGRTDNRLETAQSRPFIEDLDGLPPPSIEAFRWREYGQWTMMTSRGCPYRCSYCSSAAFWRHRVRYHSAKRVYSDMQRLMGFGARSVYIADDTFTVNRRRTLEVCGLLIADPLVPWSCLTRVDSVDEDLLAAMSAAGCVEISFGVETAVDRTLGTIRKRARFGQAVEALQACHRMGIRTRVSLILGLPGETALDAQMTLAALREVRPNEVQIYGLTPHDGTTLFDNLADLGVRILEKEPMLWSRSALAPVCETDDFSASDIAATARGMIDAFVADGYVDLTDMSGSRKIGADYTVGTAFTPVQSIGRVEAN